MPVPVTNSRDLQRPLLPGELPPGRHLLQLQLPSGGAPPGRPAELLQLRAQLPPLPSACALPEGLQPGARTQVLPHILALVDSSYAHIGCIQGPSKSMPDARRSGSAHDAGGGSSSRPFAASVRMLRCSGQRRFPAHHIMSALEWDRRLTCMATTAAPSKTPLKTSALLSTLDDSHNAVCKVRCLHAPHQEVSCATRWLGRSWASGWLRQQQLPQVCPTQGTLGQRQSCQKRQGLMVSEQSD